MLTERLRRGGLWVFALIVACALTLSACDLVGTDDEDEQDQQQQAAEQQAQQAQEEEPAPAAPAARTAPPPAEPAGPPPPPVARGGGDGELAYSILFPSVARVSVGSASATGLVISEGLVVVDAAALGGATTADVSLSNGEVLSGLQVLGQDDLTGIAYLGPVDSSTIRLLPAARLGDGESLRPGSSVYAVGYASGDAADALPSVFSGILSGVREWTPGQRSLLRTDISLPQESEGMVLVDASGTVIGVAPASIAGLGMYVSTGDLARSLRSEQMEAGAAAEPTVVTSTEHTLTVGESQPSASLFLSDDQIEARVLLTVRTETAGSMQLVDGGGELQQEASLVSGSTIVALATESYGPYEIVISPGSPSAMQEGDDEASEAMSEPVTYRVSSSVPLTSVVEAEAESLASLTIDEPFIGRIDIAGDVDTFELQVFAGGVYEATVQSLLLDSFLVIEGAGVAAVDDDSGGGLFNLDSALTIEPTVDGVIRLTVTELSNARSGSYLLTVSQISGPTAAEAESEEAMAEESGAMMMAAMLPAPAPPPTISLRGIGNDSGLQATLIGLGSQSVGNGLLVDDADGAFEIIVSVIGGDGSLGRLTVTNAQGAVVVEGRVLVSCPSGDQCLAQAIFVGNESAGGPWIVELSADEPGISEWQIEVERHE
ncbi:MAG: serine protease [Chloroflexi bacterium]|nr:serine protease [Chloroflexota bacterium]